MSLTGLTSPKEESHAPREQTLYIDLNRYNLNQSEIVNPDYDIQVRNTSVKGIDFDNISYSVINSNGKNSSFNDAMEINTTSAQINGSVSAPQTQRDPYKIIYDRDYYYCVALQWFYLNLRLDPRGANLTCTVYNEVEEAICSIPANGTSVNYLLELKPGAYYIELKGTTNNDYGGYQLNFGSNDIETDELKDTLVINDTIKQNYVGAMWTADYLPGGKTVNQEGDIIYKQTIDGTDVYETYPPRSYTTSYNSAAQIFYIWDEEILDELYIMYAAAVDYIQANQFSTSLSKIIGDVVKFVIAIVEEIVSSTITLPSPVNYLMSLTSGISTLADLIDGFNSVATAKKIDEFEDTFLRIKNDIKDRKPGDIICIRNNATIAIDNFFDSSKLQYGNNYYLNIIPFRCHQDSYFNRNPVILKNNLISNFIPADEYNNMDNYGSFTLLSKSEMNNYMKTIAGDIYNELINYLETNKDNL